VPRIKPSSEERAERRREALARHNHGDKGKAARRRYETAEKGLAAKQARNRRAAPRRRARYAVDPDYREKVLAHGRAYHAAHRERINSRRDAWNRAHPERRAAAARDLALRKKYGFAGQADYDALFDYLGGLCSVCGEPGTRRTLDAKPRPTDLDVEHEHPEHRGLYGADAVRGLVHADCNMAVSFAELPRRVELLKRARRYLRRHRRRRISIVDLARGVRQTPLPLPVPANVPAGPSVGEVVRVGATASPSEQLGLKLHVQREEA